MSFEERESNRQLMREARVGLSIVGILLCIFVYIAFKRLSGAFDQPPPAILAQVEQNSSSNSSAAAKSDKMPGMAADNQALVTDPANYDPEIDDDLQFDVSDIETAPDQKSPIDDTKKKAQPIAVIPNPLPEKLPDITESGIKLLADNDPIDRLPKSPPPTSTRAGLPNQYQHRIKFPANESPRNQLPKKKMQIGDGNRPSMIDPKGSTHASQGQDQLAKANRIKNELRTKFDDMQAPPGNNQINTNQQFNPIQLANGTNSAEPKNNNVLAQHEQPDKKQLQLPDRLPRLSNPGQFEESGNLDHLTNPKNADTKEIDTELPPPLMNHFDSENANFLDSKNESPHPPAGDKTKTRLPPSEKDSITSQFVIPEKKPKRGGNLPPTSDPKKMAPDQVTVAARDSYWSIAQRVYGNGQYFRALHQYNADKGITELSAGITISVPPISELEKKHPGLCPDSENKSAKSKSDQKPPKQGNPRPDEYITSQGDTLFSIAAEQLGQAARYIEIIKLNIDRLPKNANHLTRPRPGLRLRMPKR